MVSKASWQNLIFFLVWCREQGINAPLSMPWEIHGIELIEAKLSEIHANSWPKQHLTSPSYNSLASFRPSWNIAVMPTILWQLWKHDEHTTQHSPSTRKTSVVLSKDIFILLLWPQETWDLWSSSRNSIICSLSWLQITFW